MKMHDDQVEVAAETVAALVVEQFPGWRGLAVRPVPSTGTVNALFRLGDDVVLRFPLQPSLDPAFRAELVDEQNTARRLAALPLAVPEPLAFGEPGDGYAGPWTAYRWIPGETANDATIGDRVAFARDLADFVLALRALDGEGRTWSGRGRGGTLRSQDDSVREWLTQSTRLIDVPGLTRIWDHLVDAPPPSVETWIHADLMPGNLLVRDGRLAAVIDLGAVTVADPAVDLMPAWNLMDEAMRAVYRRALDVDEASWERGRGWALVQALGALPYYVETNPAMAAIARRTLEELLADESVRRG